MATPAMSGKILRVDLTNQKLTSEELDDTTMREYIGGTGLGAKFLYDEVAPGVEWNDPGNRLIFAIGPLNGTRVAGSGAFSVVTKGPLTNGATSSQANGYLGAYLKLSGFDAIIFQGKASDWLYLYIHDGVTELRKANHLVGKDTWETEELIKSELGKKEREMSVFGIGPAGENGIKFAAIVGDRGHVAAHNGVGAVMGAKKLKAVAVARGKATVAVKDSQKLSQLNKAMIETMKTTEPFKNSFNWGTSTIFPVYAKTGVLPVKNLTTNIFPEYEKFYGPNYRSKLKLEPSPCWACPTHHLHIVTVTEGPYAGYKGEEPEYECWAAFSSLIGQTDVGAAIMLNDVTDRMGMDGNEAGWVLAFAMECFEKGILKKQDTDGLELNWGNVEAARKLLVRIAHREGLGDVLAEGVMRAAQRIGGEAKNIAVHINKGHAPRGHDHRARWTEILDYATSGTGTIETGPIPLPDPFSPEAVAAIVANEKHRFFVDSLVVCMIVTMSMANTKIGYLEDMLNAATGWDYTTEERKRFERKMSNLLRVFNIRHGISPAVESPSPRYGSAPVDGPIQGRSIMPQWNKLLDEYYRLMGWDRRTGKPLPETLESVGLGWLIPDIKDKPI